MNEKNTAVRLLMNTVRKEAEYGALEASLSKFSIDGYRQAPCFVIGMNTTPLAILLCSIADSTCCGKTSLVIAPDEKSAHRIYGVMSELCDGVYLFPMRDLVLHGVDAFSHEAEYERMRVLRAIREGGAKIIIAVPEAVLTILPPTENIGGEIEISQGASFEIDGLLKKLVLYGYTEADTVEGKGQFSHRGDIVDIFPPDRDLPVRLEFFGDEIDACGSFDIMTQRRVENVTGFTVTPSREITLSAEQKDMCLEVCEKLILNAKGRLSALEGKKNSPEYLEARDVCDRLSLEKEKIEDGTISNIDKYLPVINPSCECLLSYIDGGVFAVDWQKTEERIKAYLWQLSETVTGLISGGMLYGEKTRFMAEKEALISKMHKCPSVITSLFSLRSDTEISGIFSFDSKSVATLSQGVDVLCEDIDNYVSGGYRAVILVKDGKNAKNIADLLDSKGIRNSVCSSGDICDLEIEKGCYIAISDTVAEKIQGYELTKSRLAIITQSDGEERTAKKRRFSGKSKTSGQKILSYQDLKVGDYVVHTVHGIARYEGIKTLTAHGVTRDYIMLQYAGSDVLYVPVGQLDRVSKYAGAGESVRLSGMNSGTWQKTKSKAKAAAREMAKKLIALYAERQKLDGYSFSEDTQWQREFELGFEYEETEGQLVAVNEIKRDMESRHPMDRLLCGDVGFGKTEVALRAIFKCVMEGKQAAILVPTTILAMQHYRTVLARMKDFPLKIAVFSRLCKAGEIKDITEKLATGKIDIVIGTHKLLGKNIKFYDLGLLVVDEEQRFGVAHKERLKEISKQIDVLTLTATPIPRTLNMAMAGIRDMSVLEEAPSNRYPVQTYVLQHDDFIIIEAIKKELRRAGQVFYLHNRVESIEGTAAKLREAFPDAEIACAHGKMSQEELSDVWQDMVDGAIDILVCTTIIETGVDVPNANTLIIEDADRLGLSQLHQIRGRIGRSGRRAYAYITWRGGASLTEVATKRLEALREFTEFGSGFKIAMRDLEIRGAGNLLGAEQSGHMEAVGYDLYIRILEEAVLEEKGIVPTAKKESNIDLRINAYIPERYIKLPSGRIEMYKKIAGIEDREGADDIIDELCDRYGEIPREVMALCEISLLKAFCERVGIRKIEQRENLIIFYPEKAEKEKTIKLAAAYRGRLLFTSGNNLCYSLKITPSDDVLSEAKGFISLYESLSGSGSAKE